MFKAWVILEEERTDVKRDDLCPKQRAKNSAEYENAGTLSPDLAARVSALLLPSAVTLLGALVASPKLEVVMEEHHSAVCQFMGQALAQVSSWFMISQVFFVVWYSVALTQ